MPINRLATVTVTNDERGSKWASVMSNIYYQQNMTKYKKYLKLQYCAWNKLDHGAAQQGQSLNPHYDAYCDDFDVFCSEEQKGTVWLAMGITAIVLGIFAWCGILRELCKDSKPIAITAMLLYSLLCIINVIVYAASSGGVSTCGHNACEFLNEIGTTGYYQCKSRMGLSLIFMMIAGVSGILSAIFTAIINYDDY